MADTLGDMTNVGVDPSNVEQDFQLLEICQKFDKKLTPRTPITSLDFEVGARVWTQNKFTLYLQILSSTKKMIQRVSMNYDNGGYLVRQTVSKSDIRDGLFLFKCDRLEGELEQFTVTFNVWIRGEKTEHMLEVQLGEEISDARTVPVPQRAPKKNMLELYPDMGVEEMHGRLGNDNEWEPPICTVECAEDARPGYQTRAAHEYEDTPATLLLKVKELARMLQESTSTLCYSGAGLSTSAGIDDYATKAGNQSKINVGRAKLSGGKKNFKSAFPSIGHRAFCALSEHDLVHSWVQQNHDGLPQKAGFPQHKLNEIHGAWFDPSNPVVAMSGNLRDDLYSMMKRDSKAATMCIAVGTSLAGMNADQVFTYQCEANEIDPSSNLGGVIIGLQKTQHDAESSLRIYARIDVVMSLLLRELDIKLKPLQNPFVPDVRPECVIAPDVFRVPYDVNGHLTEDEDEMIVWDLRDGTEIVVVDGPGEGFEGRISGKKFGGHYNCVLPRQRVGHPDFGKVCRNYTMGSWWAKTATEGDWRILPVVTKNAVLQRDWVGGESN